MQELFSGEEMKQENNNTPESRAPMKKQVFKPYMMEQQEFFLGSLEDMVPQSHIARFISAVVDRMDLNYLRKKYSGGGASAYDPAMMLKVWLLGYCYLIYTCRPLAKQLWENVIFMWISGCQKPDFHSLNNFRLLLGEEIKEVFQRVVQMAISLDIVDGTSAFIDGTIIQADANRHKIVWRKAVKKSLEKTRQEAVALAEAIAQRGEEEQAKEDRERGDKGDDSGFTRREVSIDEAVRMAEEIERMLKGKKKSGEEKKNYQRARRLLELWKREKRHEEKEKTLGERNSYAKTDPEATAMMDKEGVIRPGYSEIVVAQNQLVLAYEVDNCGERRLLKKAVSGCEGNTGVGLEELTGDGNFGDEENYDFLDKNNIEAFVKYNRYYKENNKRWNAEHVGSNQFRKKENEEALVCPEGKELKLESVCKVRTGKSYIKEIKRYKASESDCLNCPLKSKCTLAGARGVDVSERYEELKKKAKERLFSERGKMLSRCRGYEIETVFGDRKRNRKNRRYHLRGLKKVRIETGLLYTIHNLRKIYTYILNNWRELFLRMKRKQEGEEKLLLGLI